MSIRNGRVRAPMYLRQAVFLICLLSLVAPAIPAQSTKRPITAADFDSWRSLQGATITRDGKFIAYVMQPQDGDGEFIVRNTVSDQEWRAPRGYRPPTPPPDPADPTAAQAFQAQGRLLRPFFSADSKYAFFNIEPLKADLLKARRDKKRPEDMPKNALGIMDLTTGQVTKIDEVKSYQVPEDGAGYIAILKEQTREERRPDPANTGNPQPSGGPSAAGTGNGPAAPQAQTNRAGRKEYGSTLILRRLADGSTRNFADVLDYSFAKDAKSLVFGVSSRKEDTNGVYVATPGVDAAATPLLAGPGKYSRFTWDEKQTQLALISDRDDAASKQPRSKVYHWTRGELEAKELISAKTPGFTPKYVVSDRASLSFSYDGSRLFISSAPEPEPEADPNNAVPDEEKVNVDLWHWKDDYIQPTQKVRMNQDRDRSYRAVWHIKDQKFVQLADTTMESVNPSFNGLYAIGTDDRSYRVRANWDPGHTDYYLVNTLDGSRKIMRKDTPFGVSWSPNAKYGIFFDGKDWNSISVPDMKVTNLTAKLGTSFVREDHDSPSEAPAYGIAGWTNDDKEVLINDRYDIWQVSPDGGGGKNLTGGLGRREKTEMRYIRLDPDERNIDPTKPLLLGAESEETRNSGFYRLKIGGAPERLLWEAKNFGTPTKAQDADTVMFTATRFDQYPDVWVASTDFKTPKKVSNGDAQRVPFAWGTSELISYKATDGTPLKGVLIKPANFDPSKKYPMMVYLYEKLSQTVNNFVHPGPGGSVNHSVYASNGYVVFLPDIVYKIGYPGKSALNCVMGGVDAVVAKGFVDDKNIGIQGHSWGGYQIAYMVTQTNRFKAAAPGALVANMFSAYNGIRWGPGIPRQFQYENTQSRIGGTIWDSTQKFMENSPLFYLDKVQTPILMLHNDNDDAVPWYQGIEFYLSLRRLGKEVYFFNYNGEPHGLRKRQNQKDYSRRMMEFFDHNLKGAPAPDWMKKGIPYLQRDKEKEQYRPAAIAAPAPEKP